MRGLYMAQAAMLVQQSRLYLIGNNLTNLHTAGYKRDEALQSSFAEMMIYRTQSAKTAAAPVASSSAAGSAAHSVAVSQTYSSLAEGRLNYTGRNLDLALTGESFFQVQTGDGFLYTRNGRFITDQAGFLATAEGHRVWTDGGPLLIGSAQVSIRSDGAIFDGESYLGRLQTYVFSDDAVLMKSGDNFFRLDRGSAIVDENARLWPGYLESANTDLAREMTAMIQVRRSYEAAQKVMLTYDSMLNKAANELGSLR